MFSKIEHSFGLLYFPRSEDLIPTRHVDGRSKLHILLPINKNIMVALGLDTNFGRSGCSSQLNSSRGHSTELSTFPVDA